VDEGDGGEEGRGNQCLWEDFKDRRISF